MDEDNGSRVPRWVGYAFSVIIIADVGFTAWLSNKWIETESTQSAVVTDIKGIKEDSMEIKQLVRNNDSEIKGMLSDIRTTIATMPLAIDDSDRWYKELELEYQKRVDAQFKYLQIQINELKECFKQ